MARTPLFRALRRAAARAYAPPAPLERSLAAGPRGNITRRELLAGAGAAFALVGCGPRPGPAAGPAAGERIAVVGAGLAGLHCAYRLANAGARVEVFEATSRVGGRTFSLRGRMADDQVVELGGELINSDHKTLRSLVAELGLELDDLHAAVPPDAKELFHFDGRVVPEPEIVELFRPVAAQMGEAMRAAEADDGERSRLDAASIADWLIGARADPLLSDILCTAYTAEFGLEADQQSVFNLLALIDYTAPDPFRLLGDSDERYHVRGGSDRVAAELARRLGDRVQTGNQLVAVAVRSSDYLLTFERGGAPIERTADRVVLALPFSTLRQVDLTRSDLPPRKQRAIAELDYGTNAKLLTGYTERVWLTRHRRSGAAVSDQGPQMTWDSSRGQPGKAGILTVFVGGDAGVAMGRGTVEKQLERSLPAIDRLYPGAASAHLAAASVRIAWANVPFARGSYACYRPGQLALQGAEAERVGNLHFCGEHTSVEYQGYMEGATESGLRAAREILGNDM